MNDVPLSILGGILFILIIISAFFSSSETGMLALNKYRPKHLVKNKNRTAIRVKKLLEQLDCLLNLILINSNFVNILVFAITTIVTVRIWVTKGVAITTETLLLIVLIFAEVTPKTVAALRLKKVTFATSFLLAILLKVFYPIVLFVNSHSNNLLRLFGVPTQNNQNTPDSEELRTIVNEGIGLISTAHQEMLLSILDLEKIYVEDIMIPRNEVIGIDIIEDSLEEIIKQVCDSRHTRMPIYKGEIKKILGILHARHATLFLRDPNPSKAVLLKATVEPYFIPEITSLNTVLLNFQKNHQKIGVVVDKCGDIQGVTTSEDVLEEIVGEFTPPTQDKEEIQSLDDGSFRIEGYTHIREINKTLNWKLPTNDPKTLNDLIMETLKFIPKKTN